MTDPTPTPQMQAGKRRMPWGKIVLFSSLALNLLIVGLVAGKMLGSGRDRDRNPLLGEIGYGPFVHALPRADKAAMTEALKREAGSFRDNRMEIRRQFEAFLEALRADPFDAALVAKLITDQRSRIGERQALGQKLLLERIESMTASERSEYADALGHMLRRRGGRRN